MKDIYDLPTLQVTFQEISNRTERTLKSEYLNSSIASYLGVRWDSVPFNFNLMI